MSESENRQSRFTLELTLRDRYGEQRPVSMAVGVDESVRIAPRDVDALRSGLGLVSLADAAEIIRRREFRKEALRASASRLGAMLAERMEDAEGWHDESRIEPARQSLGL